MQTSGTSKTQCMVAQGNAFLHSSAHAGMVSLRAHSMQADLLLAIQRSFRDFAVRVPALHVLCPIHSAEKLGWAHFQAACMTGKVKGADHLVRSRRGGLLFACLGSCGTACRAAGSCFSTLHACPAVAQRRTRLPQMRHSRLSDLDLISALQDLSHAGCLMCWRAHITEEKLTGNFRGRLCWAVSSHGTISSIAVHLLLYSGAKLAASAS